MSQGPLRSTRYAALFILAAGVVLEGSCNESLVAPAVPSTALTDSQPVLQVPHDGRSALDVLATEEEFASAQVGYAGTPSHQARALRRLLGDPRHAELLSELWRTGTVAGQLYALVGFALTDSTRFESNIRAIATDTRVIPTLNGCIMMSDTVGRLAHEIRGEFARGFQIDSSSARMDALIDSLEARRQTTNRWPPNER